MSTVSVSAAAPSRPGLGFALAALAFAGAAAALAGWAPLGFSVLTVLLFAGPHNWLEVRYFLGRMPGRWGRLRGFFLLALAGAVGLAAAAVALPLAAAAAGWGPAGWHNATALWETALVLWAAMLVHLRARQHPRRDWSWVWPAALLLVAAAWRQPYLWGLGLVYAHPLVAFWLLDRELARSRPAWRPAFRACLAAVPVLLVLLWWRLGDAPPLAGDDVLTVRLVHHAGADLLPGVSSRLLVAAHAFLEMLHYGIWVVVIPLVAYGAAPWRLDVPLARRSRAWRRGLAVLLACGVGIVLALWGGFLGDYARTRDLYFSIAVLHVLAEVPLLLWAL